MKVISFEQYITQCPEVPLLDVRSPGEFSKGHLPGAKNLPLFSDEERAEIGTLYKQKSKQAAMMRGLDVAGSKMSWYVKRAKKLVKGKEVAVHCWRGGKRSSSIATLLEFTGYHVHLLEGGYKACRKHIRQSYFDISLKLVVLGGKTGSGKTEVLHHLASAGEQVIDLEGLAHHKGSAFGSLGELPQPTVEQFENDLFEHFRKVDPGKRVWVENESKSIGRVFIPDGLWEQMNNAVFLELEVPFDERVTRLVRDYGDYEKEELIAALKKISKRLGGLNLKNAIAAFEDGNLTEATDIALKYYDKAYQHGTNKKTFSEKNTILSPLWDPREMASQLIHFANEHNY